MGPPRSVHLQPRLLMLAGPAVGKPARCRRGFMGAWPFRAPGPGGRIEADAALQAQSAEISSAREDAQRQMDALSVHLGELQARLVRLGCPGERLTELADVDPDEFDFSRASARWRRRTAGGQRLCPAVVHGDARRTGGTPGYRRAAARGAGATARRQAHQPVDLPGRPAGAPGLHLLAVRAPGQSGERPPEHTQGHRFPPRRPATWWAAAAGW